MSGETSWQHPCARPLSLPSPDGDARPVLSEPMAMVRTWVRKMHPVRRVMLMVMSVLPARRRAAEAGSLCCGGAVGEAPPLHIGDQSPRSQRHGHTEDASGP